MSSLQYDLIVIGAGPGGYVASIRAAQLGLHVACIEMRETLGGTCLNIGCIPSKALLASSSKYNDALCGFTEHGIYAGNVKLDLRAVMARKERVVRENASGIEHLFRKNGVDWIKGRAKLCAGGVIVQGASGEVKYSAKSVIVATGSKSLELNGVKTDEKRILSSTGALALDRVPESMLVVGCGAIGLELGSVWRRYGAKVVAVELADRILPGMDGEVAVHAQRDLEKQGVSFKTGFSVETLLEKGNGVSASIKNKATGVVENLDFDVALVAVGRKPCVEGLGLEDMGVTLDSKGRIDVNDKFETRASGVYAIGDVIRGAMLAHKAEEEGYACAEIIAGKSGQVDYHVIPNVVYTEPEVASVGKTEEDLIAAKVDYKIGKFPFSANGRARAMGETAGFVKILADAKSDRILGAHIVGADAGEMIAELALAMSFGASSEDVALTCHAHPSLSEAIREAAMAAYGKCLHI